jgi:hypothetical protein
VDEAGLVALVLTTVLKRWVVDAGDVAGAGLT